MTDTTTPKKQTRGVRLNNPGNIRHSKDKWQGKAEEQLDPEFITFTTPQFGIRAMVRCLMNYEKAGYNTVRAIINRWAPPNENNTGSYIRHVCEILAVGPDDIIDVDSYDIICPLVRAIIAHENANYSYPDRVVTDAIRMAGIHDAPKKKPLELGSVRTQLTATISSGAGVIALAAPEVKKAADGLEPFRGSPLIEKIVLILLTVAGVATLIGVVGSWINAKKGM